MNLLRFFYFFNLLFLWASPALSANKLSKAWQWRDRKMLIEVVAEDRSGKELDKIPLNQMTSLRVTITALDHLPIKGLVLAKFDAQMPSHRHGMVTRAKVAQRSEDQYLITGVKLHMPGIWQLMFDLKATTDVIQVAIPLNL